MLSIDDNIGLYIKRRKMIMTDVINDLFEVTDKVHYIRYNEW